METIVAAAILVPDRLYGGEMIVTMPPPRRHHHLIHGINLLDENTKVIIGPLDQGFLTSTGRFVGRKEAYTIAKEAGQIFVNHPSHIVGTLYSEDLW